MHPYLNMKIRGKLILNITLISLLFVIPYVVYFIMISANKGNSDALLNIVHTMVPVMIAAFIVIWLIGIYIIVRLAKQLVTRINKIIEAAKAMKEGGLNVTVDYESEAELGLLAKSMNEFSAKLTIAVKEIISLLDAMAKGDLTAESHVVLEGDWKQINDSMKNIFLSLNTVFSKVQNASDQTASGAEQVASGSQALAQGATEQASSIEQLSATILEVSDHVKENASNASEANRFSSEEERKLRDASAKMDEMLKAMGEISDTSTQIGNIIKTIDDIAFQTNILALNAAVEAARAGAAGKGFAVVADEVRNLASKSAEAAKDTTSLIENAIKAVNNGTKVADVTEKTLQEVIQSANRTNALVNEIANASNQQATSISQITQGIQQISAVVQTNSATAEESAAASEELAAQSKELKHTVSSIKLHDDAQAPKKSVEKKQGNLPATEKRQSEASKAPAKKSGTEHAAQPQHPVAVAAGVPASVDDKYI
jgi:methyl-accepting chemotaxis protein